MITYLRAYKNQPKHGKAVMCAQRALEPTHTDQSICCAHEDTMSP